MSAALTLPIIRVLPALGRADRLLQLTFLGKVQQDLGFGFDAHAKVSLGDVVLAAGLDGVVAAMPALDWDNPDTGRETMRMFLPTLQRAVARDPEDPHLRITTATIARWVAGEDLGDLAPDVWSAAADALDRQARADAATPEEVLAQREDILRASPPLLLPRGTEA